MPASNGSTNGSTHSKEATSDVMHQKFEEAIANFTPTKHRGEAGVSVIDVVGELRALHARFGDTIEKLEELLIKSGDHVSKSSAELLDAIRLLSR